MHEPRTSTKQHSSGTAKGKPSLIKSLLSLKVVGGIAAVVSLFLTLNQFTGGIQEFRIHRTDFIQTMKMGQQQMQREEYPQAFDSFKHAVALDPIDRNALRQQAQAGMLWLENTQSAQMSFKDTADAVQPLLERELTRAKGEYAGDLAAHIGWAIFLRGRDVPIDGQTIENSYKQALSLDPGNVYAHAMLGHWILWNNGNLNEAREHFSAAIATGKNRTYVRTMQIAALDRKDDELLRVADQMRRGGEAISQAERHQLFEELFMPILNDDVEQARILTVVGPDDLAADYEWLSKGEDFTYPEMQQWNKEFILGFQAEANGDKKQALSRYKALQTELKQTLKSHPDRALDSIVDRAIQRVKQ